MGNPRDTRPLGRLLLAAPAVLAALLVAVIQLPAAARHAPDHPCDLVASTRGDDTATGADVEHPLRHVQTLVERLQPGQTGCLRQTEARAPFEEDVVLRDKNPSGGDESSRITLTSYPGEVAKIRGHVVIDDSANLIAVRQLVIEATAGGATVRIDGGGALIADNNITNAGASCLRAGVTTKASQVAILRNRIHDCATDAIGLGRTVQAAVRRNLIYDNRGFGVNLSPDADSSYIHRNIIDRNGSGIGFFGADASRYADHNVADSNIVARSTVGWNVGYSEMPGPAENYIARTCAYSAVDPDGGLRSTRVQGYRVWDPPVRVSAPRYRNRPEHDFRPASPGDPCFEHSGDVASVVERGGAPNDETASASNPRPNILLILTDDQRAEGTLTGRAMPNTVTRLKTQGVHFTNAFTTTPLCCPARASIMTGQYAHNHDVPNGEWGAAMRHETTLQAQLQRHGQHPYRTGAFGKFLNNWNLDREPPFWDEWSILNDGYCPFLVNEQGTRKRYPPLDPATGAPSRTPSGESAECLREEIGRTPRAPYSTDYVRDRALDFLDHGESDEATDSRPWFLYVAPFAPHGPSVPEADHAEETFRAFEETQATFEDTGDKPSGIGRKATTHAKMFGDPAQPGRRVQQLRTLRSVDDMVGALLDELERKGEQDT